MPEAGDPTLISGHSVTAARGASSCIEKEYVAEASKLAEAMENRGGEETCGSGRKLCLVMREGAVEGGADDWGEVVTR